MKIAKTILHVLLFLSSLVNVYSQTKMTLTGSQSFVDDWKRGEVKSIDISNTFDTKQKFQIDTIQISISLKYAIGLLYKNEEAKSESTILPTDNLLSGETVIKYPLGWKLDPFFSASFITQLTESIKIVKARQTTTSKFWDPVTSQQSWGFAFSLKSKTKDKFDSRIGFSLKQIRSKKFYRLADDKKTKDIEWYRAESGISWKTESFFQLDSSLSYKGTIDLFSTFDDFEIWSIKWENEFQISIWDMFGVIIKINAYYDEKIKAKLLYQQSIRIGLVADM